LAKTFTKRFSAFLEKLSKNFYEKVFRFLEKSLAKTFTKGFIVSLIDKEYLKKINKPLF